MTMLKRTVCLCLACLLFLGALPLQAYGVPDFSGVEGTTLVKRDGVWYYVKDGAVCYDTTLIKFNGSWYYVKGGTTHPEYTSLFKWNGAWWYIKEGRVASNTTTLVKWNNEWWYIVKGKVASNTTTLVKWNNEWWYIVKGKIASNTTTLVKFNGGWYYIYKGKLASNTTTLFKFNGSWYYVEKGKVNFSKTTLVKYNGTWYYVTGGRLTRTTGWCSYGNQKYYVSNGVAQTNRSGKVTVDGSVYYLRNGAMTDCHSAGHRFAAATCTTAKTCTKCTVASGAALGHDYDFEITFPTCGNKGYTTYTCRRCGHSYVGNEKEALSYHQWSVWEWVNPTCTQDGYRYRTCTCGAKETEASGSAYGHNHYLSGEKDGKLVYSCRYCDDCYYERTNTRYDAALTAPEVVRAESTDYYVGIKCPVDSAGEGTFGYECMIARDDSFNAGIQITQTDHEWNGLGYAQLSFFYVHGYTHYRVRAYRMEGDVFVYGPWSPVGQMEFCSFERKAEGKPKYTYELYFLDNLGSDVFSGSDKAVYVKTNNPNGDSIRLMANGEGATRNYVGGHRYDDVDYLDFADTEEPLRKVQGGYIAVLCIDDPGQTTLEVWEGGANGYVVGKSIGMNVLDYDAYRNSWIDNVIASQTNSTMTPLEKMEAVSAWLSRGDFRYLTNKDERLLTLASQPNGPWFLSKRWDSCTSPAMLAVIAERIGGFEEIHNCFGDYPRGTYEWAIYHHQTYVIYQGEKHYFSVCPLSSSGEVEYQTIDFSNTAQFTRFG